MNTVDEALDRSTQFMSGIDAMLDGLRIKNGADSHASAALLHLSLEHFGAIVVLLRKQMSGSAAALLRLQYESLVRGMYFYQCASEGEAEKFFSGSEPPKIGVMIERLEKKPGFTSGVFSRFHLRGWKLLNSFTHGGSAQVQRRWSGSDLANNFSDSDRIEILKAARGMALVAATHAAIAFGSIDIANEIQEKFGNDAGEP